MQRYKKLLIALAAIASIYLVKATGLDRGLIDAALDGLVEVIVGEPEAAPAPELPAEEQAPAEVLEEQADQTALEAQGE